MDLMMCMDYICSMYLSDTIELFDMVLDDDIDDPQYSAITTWNRFWVYLQYKHQTDKNFAIRDVPSLLLQCGYTDEDVALFVQKAQEERPIYHGAIFDPESF